MNIENKYLFYLIACIKKYHILTQKKFKSLRIKFLGKDMNFYMKQLKMIMDES